MAEARTVFQSFGWLENLEFSSRAGKLLPGNDDALSHAILVRKRMRLMQMLPGALIAIVFIGLAVLFNSDVTHTAQVMVPAIATSPFFAAGIAALIATIWSALVLGARMLRTDFAFYQSMLLPLFIAFAIAVAPQGYADPARDIIRAIFLAIVITADVLVFKYLRKHLIRQIEPQGLLGGGAAIAGKIENMLATDWERLKEHYKQQPPLYSFTSVQAMASEVLVDEKKDEEEPEEEAEPQPKTRLSRRSAPPAKRAALSSDDPQNNRMVEQMNARLSAAAKALAPVARALVTLIGEYANSVNNKQLGMMQGHATKIEQRGKELGNKLAEFERLCKTPMSMDSAEAEELGSMWAERANHPDIQLLHLLAERAKTFRENASESIGELSSMTDDATQAVERLKNGLSD